MTKQEIAEMLKASRLSAGLEAKEVADRLMAAGVIKSVKSFYNWESGRSQPDADTFMYLCDLYGIKDVLGAFRNGKQEDLLLDHSTDIQTSIDVQKHMELYTQLSSAGRQAADDNVFTLLMFQQAMEKQAVKACDTRIDELGAYRSLRKSEQAFSAGHGVYLGPEAFDLIHVQDNELTRRATFCGTVDGDSMEPRYHDGNILLVNSDEEVEVGEIGIFTLDGHGYVKKRGRGELISLNPNYDPIPLDDSIRCNGKVIGILNPEWIVEE